MIKKYWLVPIKLELQNYGLTWFSSAFCRPGLKLKISITAILNSILLTSRTAKIGKCFVLVTPENDLGYFRQKKKQSAELGS